MRNIFFVDSENVGDSWIQLFDYLNDDDCILVFYTDKSPNMSYANVVALKQSPFEPEFILCENGTDNALDFQFSFGSVIPSCERASSDSIISFSLAGYLPSKSLIAS